MLRIEGSEYFGRMVDGDILKLYVKGTVEETHQKYATDAVVELLRPTLEVEVRVQKYPVRGLHKAGTRAKKEEFQLLYKTSSVARESKTVLDSGFVDVDSAFFFSGNWIPDYNH